MVTTYFFYAFLKTLLMKCFQTKIKEILSNTILYPYSH